MLLVVPIITIASDNTSFMVGNKVVEFSYSMYEDVPDQTLGPKFFKQIIDSIEYSSEFNN